MWTEEKEATRQAVNTWLRGAGKAEFGGVIDFDAGLYSEQGRKNPYPRYAALHEHGPVNAVPRRAEHSTITAVDDCHAALRRLAGHAEEFRIDPDRLAVGGDSAGGNLAAAVTLLARADGGPRLAAQVLYPNTDQRPGRAFTNEEDPMLFNRHSVEWYRRHYLAGPGHAAQSPASPLLAEDLAGPPPALVITAEHDPLRDEGERYAGRLAESGVPTEATRYDGMVHGFFAMPGVFDAGKRAQEQAAAFLRARFGLTPAGAAAGAATGGSDHG